MDRIQPLQILQEKFSEKFESFDYDFYENVVSKRTLNNYGIPTGSVLIIEVATISSFFMSERIKENLIIEDVCFSAFYGWKLSYELISKGADKNIVSCHLEKFCKTVKKNYKSNGLPISTAEISWLIFCCAMIREKFYNNFPYNMFAFMLDPGKEENVVRVAFKVESSETDLLPKILSDLQKKRIRRFF